MNEIKTLLMENADDKYREFTDGLNPADQYPRMGVRFPVMRRIGKELVREKGMNALEMLTDDTYEEVTLQGLVIAGTKMNESDKKALMDRYLDKCGDSWSLVDTFVTSFKLKDKNLWNRWTQEYVLSGKNAQIRFGYVMMMKLLQDEYIDGILESVIAHPSDVYYVQMAQAWLLATAAIKYSDKVERILAENRLNRFTHNKTIQKMVESFRINDEVKQKVRGMRR
ncbi:MAG: DNA alkylation repair protein [Erysipelotrichaceae bacterium]|nr:DNA alkylation repair protein [Erysipelotrichaceae bacterium]